MVSHWASADVQIEEFLSRHPGKFFSGGDKPGLGDVSGSAYSHRRPLTIVHDVLRYQLAPQWYSQRCRIQHRPGISKVVRDGQRPTRLEKGSREAEARRGRRKGQDLSGPTRVESCYACHDPRQGEGSSTTWSTPSYAGRLRSNFFASSLCGQR